MGCGVELLAYFLDITKRCFRADPDELSGLRSIASAGN